MNTNQNVRGCIFLNLTPSLLLKQILLMRYKVITTSKKMPRLFEENPEVADVTCYRICEKICSPASSVVCRNDEILNCIDLL